MSLSASKGGTHRCFDHGEFVEALAAVPGIPPIVRPKIVGTLSRDARSMACPCPKCWSLVPATCVVSRLGTPMGTRVVSNDGDPSIPRRVRFVYDCVACGRAGRWPRFMIEDPTLIDERTGAVIELGYSDRMVVPPVGLFACVWWRVRWAFARVIWWLTTRGTNESLRLRHG